MQVGRGRRAERTGSGGEQGDENKRETLRQHGKGSPKFENRNSKQTQSANNQPMMRISVPEAPAMDKDRGGERKFRRLRIAARFCRSADRHGCRIVWDDHSP